MKKTSVSLDFAGRTLTLETGQLAQQATAAILARLGDTMVLATVVEGGNREDLGYFPLTVEYVERLYAGGRIKGSRWVKREGRPSDEAILIGRLIDRSIRPLFPKEYKKEVQVIVTVLSVDGENEPDILAINAVSAALAISPIPWNGPVGAIRMGYVRAKDGEEEAYLANPTTTEAIYSELDLVVSNNGEKTIMIEAGGAQVPEAVFVEAMKRAHTETSKMIDFIKNLVKEIGKAKAEVPQDQKVIDVAARIEKSYKDEIVTLTDTLSDKESGGGEAQALVTKMYEDIKMAEPESEIDSKTIGKALEKVMYKMIRQNVLTKKKRVDGRKIDEIRPLAAQVSVLPRTHGSAVFQRGLTQALTVVTLGSPRMEQLIESAEGEESKRYMHHYSMPPYSVGEAGRIGAPSRREIGHGALAERALEPVIPKKEDFPYTIRVVSEILSSNGSTSMASVCGSALALMDAGVPIVKPVAGISIGMMSDEEDYVLLTDIIGLEDFSGDMDCKVAGTDEGITAIQLDVKIPGLTAKQIEETLFQARSARMVILEKIYSVIPSSRAEISEFAPKIEVIQIPVEKIGDVIGPGGKVIKNIIATTGATVDVDDLGNVTVTGTEEESVKKAVDWVRSITRDVTPGEVFTGTVKRILPFGAFVEILPGKEGMVHVSQMAKGFVKNPEDVVQIGQTVKVRVMEIDEQGRINLSMLFGAEAEGRARLLDRRGPDAEDRGADLRRSGDEGRGRRHFGGGSGGRGYERRPGGGGGGRGRRDGRPGEEDHPLTRMFRRERQEQKKPYKR